MNVLKQLTNDCTRLNKSFFNSLLLKQHKISEIDKRSEEEKKGKFTKKRIR